MKISMRAVDRIDPLHEGRANVRAEAPLASLES